MRTHLQGRRARHGRAIKLAVALMAGCCAIAPSTVAAKSFDYTTWDAYLGGAESAQYSALNQITTANVKDLKVAWTFETGTGSPPAFGPLVANGTMYVTVRDTFVVALDPATGKEKWRTEVKGRLGSRGMDYWQSKDGKDKRLIFLSGGFLRQMNADTGEFIKGFGMAPGEGIDIRIGLSGDISKVRPLQTNNPGRVYGDLVIMSLPAGGYDYTSSPADIHAYNIVTGKLAWVFHVKPEKGEFGYETWPEKDRDRMGGVHNWSEATVDDQAGVIYIPTGTARYDFYGGNRPGDNLFANSVLALDAKTGKRLWHFQTVHHDLWDYDIPLAPKLMTITKDGKDIPVVVQATKQGFIFVLDRKTGVPIWPVEERPVPQSDVPGEKTSPTQPFPTWPEPFTRQGKITEADINPFISEADKAKARQLLKTARNEGIFTPPSLRGSISLPGHNGGANFGMSAIDPVNHRYYVIDRVLPTLDTLVPDKRPEAIANMPNGGGDVTPYQSPVNFNLQSNGFGIMGPPWSSITAYDMDTGKKLWTTPNGEVKPLADLGIKDTGSHIGRGHPVVTAGGLFFNATSSDRKFRARDSATGKTLWEADLPAASEGIPAVYEVNGRQFIVIPVGGDGLWAPKLPLPKAGANQYIAFALPEGSAPPSTPAIAPELAPKAKAKGK
ncbi:MAG: PQQ-binding-like beta-propeller repeat protein [Sphingobium sp.]|nr:PQQ-binding-like beta-propeller repeat protein [Sphingobium sp.]